MRKERINNKGFSLVELIIVVAIMAILAGALAPQLLKYIEDSRKSKDVSVGESIATAVQTALTDEAAYTAATSQYISDIISAPATDAFTQKVFDIFGASSAPKPKMHKATNDDFFIQVTTVGGIKTFKVYACTNAATPAPVADYEVSPGIGAKYQ